MGNNSDLGAVMSRSWYRSQSNGHAGSTYRLHLAWVGSGSDRFFYKPGLGEYVYQIHMWVNPHVPAYSKSTSLVCFSDTTHKVITLIRFPLTMKHIKSEDTQGSVLQGVF